jgi:hypothetical protein
VEGAVSETLTKEQRAKRVAICQDVLDQLAAEKYVANRWTYGDFSKSWTAPLRRPECEVCAVGAVFLSKLRLVNEAPSTPPNDSDVPHFEAIQDNLLDLFPDARAIERRFMADTVGTGPWFDDMPADQQADHMAVLMSDIIADDGALVR